MGGAANGASRHRDVIVIGSGFGGALAAWALVRAGQDVLMLERGPWVARGPENWGPEGTLIRTPYFNGGSEFVAETDRGRELTASCSCVGGASVFCGAVSLRYREADFLPDPDIVTDSGSVWPIGYDELRPYYLEAERVLGVAGHAGLDPTEPPRRERYPARLPPLSEVSRRIAEGASSLGLTPFRLPLAISFAGNGNGDGHASGTARRNGAGAGDPEQGGGPECVECGSCDTFACALGAKNDVASRVLPRLIARGLELRAETAVTGFDVEGGRVAGVRCLDRRTGEVLHLTADRFVLAAGALGSAHLVLASGLEARNPAGDAVGRYLTRHCSAIVYGAYGWLPGHADRFHKQIGIHDYYFGDARSRSLPGKLGGIQQVQTPSISTVEAVMPAPAMPLLRPLVSRITGLLALAEERPRYENGVRLDRSETDEVGLPRLIVEHRYDQRDLDARALLVKRAREIHRATGSRAHYVHRIDTFSHAIGTLRMGSDPERSPLDPECRFRGLENLFVVDGSALPTGAAVNPSLTISANALRVGEVIAREALGEGRGSASRLAATTGAGRGTR